MSSLTLEERTMKKIRRRILPWVFLLYVIAFLDRANVAFAKLTMSGDLRFSEAVYGLGAGLFFLGYFLLEIPGADRAEVRRSKMDCPHHDHLGHLHDIGRFS